MFNFAEARIKRIPCLLLFLVYVTLRVCVDVMFPHHLIVKLLVCSVWF